MSNVRRQKLITHNKNGGIMKILTVFTGGTIACSSRDGVLSPDESNGFLLLDMYNKTYGGAELETAVP